KRVRPAVNDLGQHDTLLIEFPGPDYPSAERLVEPASGGVRLQAADPQRGHPMLRQVCRYRLDEAAAETAALVAVAHVEDANLTGILRRVPAGWAPDRQADDLPRLVLG